MLVAMPIVIMRKTNRTSHSTIFAEDVGNPLGAPNMRSWRLLGSTIVLDASTGEIRAHGGRGGAIGRENNRKSPRARTAAVGVGILNLCGSPRVEQAHVLLLSVAIRHPGQVIAHRTLHSP